MNAPVGSRVRYVGMTGRITDGPVGRVDRVGTGGVRVRWDGIPGTQVVHPEGLQLIGRRDA